MTRSGFVALVGRPNTGKSTLLNCMIGEKIAIVSYRPQTTRSRIVGILTQGDDQIVFTDTPGIHTPKTRLGEEMISAANGAIVDCDLTLLVAEPRLPGNIEKKIIAGFQKNKVPAILVLNKIDTVSKETLLPVIAAYAELYNFLEVVPVSARTQDGVGLLIRILKEHLTEGPFFYPEDQKTDVSEPMRICEIIREKLLMLLQEEIPHGLALEMVQMEHTPTLLRCGVNIYCEKDSHKRIIIGKDGSFLKQVGMLAREELERQYQKKVHLELWIKVNRDWRNNPAKIRSFGLQSQE